MDLSNDFRVSAPIEQAWEILTDLERVAPCMPGATLHEVLGDEYRGAVKIKVGPITAEYKGTVRIAKMDEANRQVVLLAEGRESRGQGNAEATITATLTPDGEGTAVAILTELSITGKVAQFGRGVLASVSTKLLGQFVTRLEEDLLGTSADGTPSEDAADSGGESTSRPSPVVRPTRTGDAEPIDLLEATWSSLPRWAVQITFGTVAVTVLALLLRHRRHRARSQAA